jgi:hypothetical protein
MYVDWDIFEETLAVSVPEEEWAEPEIGADDAARGLSYYARFLNPC